MNYRSLNAALVMLILSPVLARAGTDDIHVVTKLTGFVEVRTLHRRGNRVTLSSWKQVKLHQVLYAGVEVRSAPHASAWLQTGDQVQDSNKLPADVGIPYCVLTPRSLVRLNRQGRGLALVQTLQGHTYRMTMHGKIPNTMYYKNEHRYQRN